jgi:hypothetical protein
MVIEAALEVELDDHLGYAKHKPLGCDGGDSRNSHPAKTVLTEAEPVEQCRVTLIPASSEGRREKAATAHRGRGHGDIAFGEGFAHGEITCICRGILLLNGSAADGRTDRRRHPGAAERGVQPAVSKPRKRPSARSSLAAASDLARNRRAPRLHRGAAQGEGADVDEPPAVAGRARPRGQRRVVPPVRQRQYPAVVRRQHVPVWNPRPAGEQARIDYGPLGR